jgi:hypothetical protein
VVPEMWLYTNELFPRGLLEERLCGSESRSVRGTRAVVIHY